MLLVCEACRLVFMPVLNAMRVGIHEGIRDTTPASCRVFCRLPRLHPLLGSMMLSCWKPIHRDEPLTQGPEERGLRAGQTTPVRNGQDGRTALRGCCDVMRRGAHHLAMSLAPATGKYSMAAASYAASLPAGAVAVTRRLAQMVGAENERLAQRAER